MALHDVTRSLHEGMAGYDGDPPVRRWCYRRLPQDAYEASALALGAHAGTHIDAPRHFFASGLTVDALPLEWLCGQARVLDLRDAGPVIDAAALARHELGGAERILLRTVSGASLDAGRTEPTAHLTVDAARLLLERPRHLVGIDALSIEAAHDPSYPVHRMLLGANPPVIVLEGLDLEAVTPGDYELWCLPLKWREAEASPVRALLRTLANP